MTNGFWTPQKNKSEQTKELVSTLKAEREELESSLNKEKIHSLQLKQELADAENRNTELYKVIALPKTDYISQVRGEHKIQPQKNQTKTEKGSVWKYNHLSHWSWEGIQLKGIGRTQIYWKINDDGITK